jgi:deoxyribonucleoside regulator
MTPEPDHLNLLAQIATWYYEEGLGQEVIARRINRSRSMVSRLLSEAREAGLVDIRVHYPLKTHTELEQRLQQTFGLKRAVVLAQPPGDYGILLRRLGELGARVLQAALHDNILIGVGSGTGVHAVVRAMPQWPVAGATVVQVVGAIGYGDPIVDGAEVARWLAEKLSAAYRYLSAPLVVEDEKIAEGLLRERSVAETLALAARVEVLVIGVGSVKPAFSSLMRAGYMDAADLASLAQQRVVGDIMARQLDIEGRVVDVPVNRQIIGIQDLGILRSIPMVLAAAGGVEKTPAILAALRGQYLNTLITDANTAAMVLEREQGRQR